MPDRIRTRDDVTTVLAELFRGRGAYVLAASEVERSVNWRRRFLENDREGWDALVMRAQSIAAGESARERYASRGWGRKRYENAWRRGADAIAAGFARERINAAALEAGEQAEDRLLQSGRLALPQSEPCLLTG